MRQFLIALSLLVVTQTYAATEKVLLPIYIDQPLPGAFGSSWVSDFTIHNPTGSPYVLETCFSSEGYPCLAILHDDEDLLPGETQKGLPARYPEPAAANPGAVLYLFSETGGPADLTPLAFQLWVKDLSRNALSAGTELPVVRDSAFRTSTISLLSVPVDTRFRLLLRIYDMNLDTARFRVRIVNEETGVALSERVVTAAVPRAQQPYRFDPAFAQVSDLVDTAAQGTPDHVRVEVEPLSGGSAFWAFVSVTNNQTQEFTVLTPQ